ncbi:hypothetical protein IFM89_018798 [Coptis chinensis]|uniref:Pyruvate kinase n=1 Tax=Coptis chinensis TaxID=261450 RepID=A0A835IDB7_9MAGN|nr:hypothetical protein IFM89_018798 [Coptis chinensis]
MASTEQLVSELSNPDLRENALLDLSKHFSPMEKQAAKLSKFEDEDKAYIVKLNVHRAYIDSFHCKIQEEIISICGAAHIPVIWATQVLESLVKSGLPTRAEITDVANGRR